MIMAWTIDRADRKEAWSWGPREWGDEAWTAVIQPKLIQFQAMYWREIEAARTDTGHRMHHSMPTDIIHSECRDRLSYLDIDNDEIYRFRLGNRRRLWGFRI
jgi:hypothetical protein